MPIVRPDCSARRSDATWISRSCLMKRDERAVMRITHDGSCDIWRLFGPSLVADEYLTRTTFIGGSNDTLLFEHFDELRCFAIADA